MPNATRLFRAGPLIASFLLAGGTQFASAASELEDCSLLGARVGMTEERPAALEIETAYLGKVAALYAEAKSSQRNSAALIANLRAAQKNLWGKLKSLPEGGTSPHACVGILTVGSAPFEALSADGTKLTDALRPHAPMIKDLVSAAKQERDASLSRIRFRSPADSTSYTANYNCFIANLLVDALAPPARAALKQSDFGDTQACSKF